MPNIVICHACDEPFDNEVKIYDVVSRCDPCCRTIKSAQARKRYKNDPAKRAKDSASKKKRMLVRGDAVRAVNRINYKKSSVEVSESYARALLVKRTTLSAKDVPASLVELKRQAIKLQRLLKELS